MPGNPFYNSGFWKKLKGVALQRAGRVCEIEGCGRRAAVVDHIQTRPRFAVEPTAWDVVGNLRCLCRMHDNQIKEKKDGTRKLGGKAYLPGVDKEGFPVDPAHPWFQGGKDE